MTAPTTTITTPPATVDEEAPPVRLEPCPGFRLDHEAPCPTCAVCGWLEHDHAAAAPVGDAVVTVLPRLVAVVPQRLAS